MRTAAITLCAIGAMAGVASAAPIAISVPNASFEDGDSQYNVPDNWQEDQPRPLEGPGFASSGNPGELNGLVPYDGTQMLRVALNGDADAGTSYSATVSTADALGQYQADTAYTLSFFTARNDYVNANEWIVLGGLLADDAVIASIDQDIRAFNGGSGAEDTWYQATVSFSTVDNPGVVGEDIGIYLGMRHQANHNKGLFFDSVSLMSEAVPEPGALALVGLAGAGLLRRRRRA